MILRGRVWIVNRLLDLGLIELAKRVARLTRSSP
jgi:hypothetical protein